MAKKMKAEKAVPEVVADGVVRDAGKENPILDNDMERPPRVAGAWKKVTYKELCDLEAAGKLKGYDPSTNEALIKE